ncbi:MAG TPA: fumarylacetoacetate hydrolase family protein [Polyangiaceae bacterium]|nr:fumarylacetoacetate hydrolase family protein [Polyangiaceae bacterium]
MNYAFPLPMVPRVPIEGTDASFPVRRIYCVGRNYAEHAREMGFEPEREAPFFFTKPADAIVANGATIAYALATENLHHEIELVVALGRGGVQIAREAALGHVYGYAVGLDMTRRDLQLAARDKGRPWDVGKAFDESAPISAIRRASDIGHPESGAIRLSVNGVERQSSDLKQLLWPVADLIVELSKLFELRPGDLIYTGTPAGVGPVRPGDELYGQIERVGELSIRIGPRSSGGNDAR